MHPILSDILTQFEAVRREKLTKRAVADLGRYERIHKTLTLIRPTLVKRKNDPNRK